MTPVRPATSSPANRSTSLLFSMAPVALPPTAILPVAATLAAWSSSGTIAVSPVVVVFTE